MHRRLGLLLLICGVAACGGGGSGGAPDGGTPSPDAEATPDAAPDAAPDLACEPTDPRSGTLSAFIGPDGVTQPVLDLINGATTSIDLMMYELNVAAFPDALIAAHDRGVNVRVILDYGQTINADAAQRLTTAGIEVHDAPVQFTYYHAKVLVVDGERAIVMSANLNYFSTHTERNYGVVEDDSEDVADLERIFEADFAGGTTAPDLACTRLLVSPVNARKRLLDLINGAQSTLDLSVMYLSDDGMLAAVKQRAAAGVAVRVLLADPAWIDGNAATAADLAASGIPAKYLLTYELHAKLMVADGVAFVGSENLSYTSLNKNREVGVLVTEPAPAGEIAAQFEADWAAGTSP